MSVISVYCTRQSFAATVFITKARTKNFPLFSLLSHLENSIRVNSKSSVRLAKGGDSLTFKQTSTTSFKCLSKDKCSTGKVKFLVIIAGTQMLS